MEPLLNTRKTSEMLGVHVKTTYQWAKEGRIPHLRINGLIRFDRREIEAWKEKNRKRDGKFFDLLPKFELSMENYDKMLLKERSALGKKPKRWNYGFGAVYERRTKKGKLRWYVDYRDESGKRKQELVGNAQNREEAVIALQRKVFEAFSRQNDVKPRPKSISFDEFADLYLEDYAKVNKRSWKADRSYLKSMRAVFRGMYLNEISSLHVEKYKAERLGQGVKHSTVNRCLAILKRMFNLAVEWGFLRSDHVGSIKLFSEKDNHKERILSVEEEKILLSECSAHLRPIVVTALNTGMRKGEILNLEWSQVDLSGKRIRVEKTKSGRTRFVDVNSVLAKELAVLKKKTENSGHVFVNSGTGRPFVDVKKAFRGACRRAGIPDLRFHDLRHTFATRLVERGVDLITVKEILGHSTVRITERYTHSNQERKKKAVEVLAGYGAEGSGKRPNLLRMRDTGKKAEKGDRLFPFFSVN